MDKVEAAYERLRFGEKMAKQMYGKPLLLCYSGGKDSQVLLRLAIESGIEFEAQHSHTTVDAPETVMTVRETFRKLGDMGIPATINKPEMTMWQLIPYSKMPPTRIARYCCRDLKEQHGRDRFICTGVRRGESRQRSKRGTFDAIAKRKDDRQAFGDEVMLTNDGGERRREFERCMPKNTMCVNPIIDWTDADVWEYFNRCEVRNPMYGEGWGRVGCIGCPMAGRHRWEEFKRYPSYKRAYIRAFGKMLQARRDAGLSVKDWESGEDVFRWWMEDRNVRGQMELWGDVDG